MDKKAITLQQLEEALRDLTGWLRDKLRTYLAEPAAEGKSGYVLTTNGAGGRSWEPGGAVRPDDSLSQTGIPADAAAVGAAVAGAQNAAEAAQNAADAAQAAADAAVTTEKLMDGSVTRAKLASDALYSPCVISDSRELTASDIGATIQNKWGVSATFTLTQAASASMPIGSTIAFLKLGPMAMDGYTVAIQTSGVRLGVTCDKYYPTEVTLKIADYMGEIALRKASNDGAGGDFWVVIGNVEVVS